MESTKTQVTGSHALMIVMTPKEVSRILGLPVSKVYLMIREGLIDGVKIGSDWRIRTLSVQRYLPEEKLAA